MTTDLFEKIRNREGDHRAGEYKGFKWEIKRHPDLLHLCGYIIFPKDIDSADFEFHKQEITYDEVLENGDRVCGFDCAHYGMLIPYQLYIPELEYVTRPGNIYWTMEMCLAIIRTSIDNWLENK